MASSPNQSISMILLNYSNPRPLNQLWNKPRIYPRRRSILRGSPPSRYQAHCLAATEKHCSVRRHSSILTICAELLCLLLRSLLQIARRNHLKRRKSYFQHTCIRKVCRLPRPSRVAMTLMEGSCHSTIKRLPWSCKDCLTRQLRSDDVKVTKYKSWLNIYYLFQNLNHYK